MPNDRSFWRNAAIIGVAHVIVLGGVARWSSQATKPLPRNIVWLDGGAAGLTSSAATAALQLPLPPPEQREEPPPTVADEDAPMLTPVKSDIELPTATPTATPVPTPIPTATPQASPKPSAAPTARPSPKSTPKPTPKVTPSASPKKTLIVKAEPTPVRKPATAPAKPEATPAAAAAPDAPTSATTAAATATGGRSNGPGPASQDPTYGRILHDRFYNAWEQPTSVIAAGRKMSALVRIRIEKDGRVTGFNIIRPSGNVLVDESVAAVGRRVTQVDPPPAGLGSSAYQVNMNFELTQ